MRSRVLVPFALLALTHCAQGRAKTEEEIEIELELAEEERLKAGKQEERAKAENMHKWNNDIYRNCEKQDGCRFEPKPGGTGFKLVMDPVAARSASTQDQQEQKQEEKMSKHGEELWEGMAAASVDAHGGVSNKGTAVE